MEHDGEEYAAGAEPRALTAGERDALAEALASRSLRGLVDPLRTETARRVRALRASSDPAALLVAWWGSAPADVFDAGTNLVAHARVGHAQRVRDVIHRPNRKYLRRVEALVDAVRDEMCIQELTVERLSERAETPPDAVRGLLDDGRVPGVGTLYQLLEALGIDASTIPGEAVESSRESAEGADR